MIAPELFESYGFFQLIDIPTRITQNTTLLVDLIFVQNQDYLSIQGTLPKIEDHDGTLVSFHSTRLKILPKTIIILDYNKINEVDLIKHTKNIDFQTIVFSQPLIDQPRLMTTLMTGAFHKFVPSREVTIRPNAKIGTILYTKRPIQRGWTSKILLR